MRFTSEQPGVPASVSDSGRATLRQRRHRDRRGLAGGPGCLLMMPPACLEGSFSSAGQTACSLCSPRNYSMIRSAICTSCSPGLFCFVDCNLNRSFQMICSAGTYSPACLGPEPGGPAAPGAAGAAAGYDHHGALSDSDPPWQALPAIMMCRGHCPSQSILSLRAASIMLA